MKKNRKRIDPRYFLEETAMREGEGDRFGVALPGESEGEGEGEGEVEEPADKYFGIFKISGGHETVTAVSKSVEGLKKQFEEFMPRPPDERIAAIIQGRLLDGNMDIMDTD